MGVLRRDVIASSAGSRRVAPGWCGRLRRRAWLAPSPKDFNDGHAATAAGTGWEPIEGLWCFGRLWWRSRGKQFAGTRYGGLAGGTRKQAVVANAVEAVRQYME